MNLEQQITEEKSPEIRLAELQDRRARMIKGGIKDSHPSIKQLDADVIELSRIVEGGETLKGLDEEYKSDAEANISFHRNLITGLEKGISEKEEKIKRAELEEADLYGKELSADKGEMTAEENADFQIIQAKRKNNAEFIEDLKAKIEKDREVIETHKKTIEAQESKTA